MPASSIPPVPPGSTPLRELALAIDGILTLPEPPPDTSDEQKYLRVLRDRAVAVRDAARRIRSDIEIEHDERDVMNVVAGLKRQARLIPADVYTSTPGPQT
jgi:hypothetical protein